MRLVSIHLPLSRRPESSIVAVPRVSNETSPLQVAGSASTMRVTITVIDNLLGCGNEYERGGLVELSCAHAGFVFVLKPGAQVYSISCCCFDCIDGRSSTLINNLSFDVSDPIVSQVMLYCT